MRQKSNLHMPQILPSNHIGTEAGSASQPFIQRGTPAYRRASLALFAAGLATFTILYCVQPLFPLFTAQFHVSPVMASLSLSLTTILLAITLPIAGIVSDAIGRKSVMTISLVVSAICCILTALAPDFAVLLVIRAIQGIVLAGVPAVAMAYLSEEVESMSLGFAMGLYISGNTIGGLFGRIVVGMITDISTWRIAIIVLGAISLLAFFYFWRSLPSSRHFQRVSITPKHLLAGFGRQFRDPGLICLFLMGALLMGGFVTLYNYLGYRLMAHPYDLSESIVGWIFIVYLVGTFSSSWMGRKADTVGRRKILFISVGIMLMGVLITLTHSIVLIILGVAVFTFGFFGGHSTASSWVGRRAVSGRGQASSLYLFFYYVGSSLGGSAGGLFWSHFQWAGIVAMISGLLVLALIVAGVLSGIPPVTKPRQ